MSSERESFDAPAGEVTTATNPASLIKHQEQAFEDGTKSAEHNNVAEHSDFISVELTEVDEEAVLRRAATELAERKAEARALALIKLARTEGNSSLAHIEESIEDESPAVRSAATRALYDLAPKRAASLINNILREGPAERRRQIGSALVDSELAAEAIGKLNSKNGPEDYEALSLVFLLAKSGTVDPLIQLIEGHAKVGLRLALIKLLGASRQPEVITAFHRLTMSGSLAPEVRSALMATIYESRSRRTSS